MNEPTLCPSIKRDGSPYNGHLGYFTHLIGCKSHSALEDSIFGCSMDALRTLIILRQAGAYLNEDKRSRAVGNIRVNIPCTLTQFDEEPVFFAPGSQADGFILYNGHLNEILFQIIRNRLGPNPNHHPNTLQN